VNKGATKRAKKKDRLHNTGDAVTRSLGLHFSLTFIQHSKIIPAISLLPISTALSNSNI